MFLQWLGLTNAALLCYSRRWLARLTVPQSSVAVFALILLNTVVISELALWLGTAFGTVGHHGAALRALAVPAAQRRHRHHRHGAAAALLLRDASVAEARARGSAVTHSSAAGAHPAALPVQQHEHDRGADAQRPEARRGGRRGSRRSVSRDAARLAQPAAAQRRARAHAHLSAHRSVAARRPARRDLGRRRAADARVRAGAHGAAVARERDLPRHRAARARRHGHDLGPTSSTARSRSSSRNPVAQSTAPSASRATATGWRSTTSANASISRTAVAARCASSSSRIATKSPCVFRTPNERGPAERPHRRRRTAGARTAAAARRRVAGLRRRGRVLERRRCAAAGRQAEAVRRAARHPHAGHDGHRGRAPPGRARAPAGYRVYDGVRRVRARKRSSRRPSATS